MHNILEKVVAKRVGSHIISNSLSNVFQSTSKKSFYRECSPKSAVFLNNFY